MNWKDVFKKSAALIEDQWDDLRYQFKLRLKVNDPVQIIAYRTYGTATHVYKITKKCSINF